MLAGLYTSRHQRVEAPGARTKLKSGIGLELQLRHQYRRPLPDQVSISTGWERTDSHFAGEAVDSSTPAAEAEETEEAEDVAPLLGTAILRSLPITGSELRGVGSRLAGFHTQWESLLGTCRATMVLQTGVVLQFISSPPLTRVPVVFGDSVHALQAAVDTLVAKGAVHQVRRVCLARGALLFVSIKLT